MKISKRLLSLTSYFDSNDHIADIGCDHALLDIYLVMNNIVDSILISDINESALNNGIANIKKYHLTDKVIPKLGFGLDTISGDVDTLLISGMGTSTICKILDDSKIYQINKLVIQSNNDYYELRKSIVSKGFYIAKEDVVFDNNKYYINIVFLKGRAKYSFKEYLYGPILIQEGSKEYFNYLYDYKKSILNKIPKKQVIMRFRLKNELRLLNNIKKK